ncbi:MAG: crossover junction endodeoxyribonuclease RuvC [Caldilineaceae bacterium SB0665_bin_21]|nr:crossover junction endodeoxyribonuclease RuvC [Caldilineaceae bacterium SB0665_bin_21]MYA04599.1 crossover junction endodeoxyribonuclease RuvC [Caldilineaceae bacterium SB0664_bin_22]MYC61233.1 crossover junction endodeoxyribonuclease RuvC [Caldilineaceae bacterium SB0661_bin_34]
MSLVLGIDPGIARLGYGLVREWPDRSLGFVDCGVITTPADWDLEERLQEVNSDIGSLLDEHRPEAVAMEQLTFGSNSPTAFAVGCVCGVVMSNAAGRGMKVSLYAPAQVKQQLTGTGRADKQQMQQMVRLTLGLDAVPRPDDAADGLAVALCHLYRQKFRTVVFQQTGNPAR